MGRPPGPLSSIRHSYSTNRLATSTDDDRAETSLRIAPVPESEEYVPVEFRPSLRSGGYADIGRRLTMEDEHVRIDDLVEHLGTIYAVESPRAFYGVFDGHNGRDAAQFVKEKLLQYIVDDVAFPSEVEKAVCHGFRQTDLAFAEAFSTLDVSSGTTAITVLIFGRNLIVANAGDCRAVLCRRGKAVVMSNDHTPCCDLERSRIEALGGFVVDGYLNGQLGVTRALGDWHMKGLQGVESPLTGEPELQQTVLSEADEFMIIGCDGLWDVFTNENAVDFARRRLQQHNDPELCSRQLVAEALSRRTVDNLTVLIVCFQADPPPRLAIPFRGRRTISAEGLQNLQDLVDGFQV